MSDTVADTVSKVLLNVNPLIGNFWSVDEINAVSNGIQDIGCDIGDVLKNAISEPTGRLFYGKKNKHHHDKHDKDNKDNKDNKNY